MRSYLRHGYTSLSRHQAGEPAAIRLLQIGGEGVGPDVVGEPVPVLLGNGAEFFGLSDGTAVSHFEDTGREVERFWHL